MATSRLEILKPWSHWDLPKMTLNFFFLYRVTGTRNLGFKPAFLSGLYRHLGLGSSLLWMASAY